eukprot:225226_1
MHLKLAKSVYSLCFRQFSRRRHQCNSSFFKSWNPSMAYWLGFLFADGNVHHTHSNSVIQLALKCIDYEHVAKLKKALNSTYKLGFHKTNFQTCATSHQIYDKSLALDLINLGCIPKKSLTLEWPQNIPDPYIHHFVRGYFDGDGSIYFNKQAK